MSRSCGICGNLGHNRRTCPNSIYNRSRSEPAAANTVNSQTANMVSTRKAKCGYCIRYIGVVDRTHNVRTCPHRKNALNDFISSNRIWAKNYKEQMKKIGFGIGCIVAKNDAPYIVETVSWEEVSSVSNWGAYRGRKLEQISQDSYFYMTGLAPPSDNSYCKIEVLSPVSPDIVEKQFPPDWENGMYAIPNHLRDSATGGRRKKN